MMDLKLDYLSWSSTHTNMLLFVSTNDRFNFKVNMKSKFTRIWHLLSQAIHLSQANYRLIGWVVYSKKNDLACFSVILVVSI